MWLAGDNLFSLRKWLQRTSVPRRAEDGGERVPLSLEGAHRSAHLPFQNEKPLVRSAAFIFIATLVADRLYQTLSARQGTMRHRSCLPHGNGRLDFSSSRSSAARTILCAGPAL